MPPWHADPNHGEFSNSRGLSLDEKKADRWTGVDAGAPEGRPGSTSGAASVLLKAGPCRASLNRIIAMSDKTIHRPGGGNGEVSVLYS